MLEAKFYLLSRFCGHTPPAHALFTDHIGAMYVLFNAPYHGPYVNHFLRFGFRLFVSMAPLTPSKPHNREYNLIQFVRSFVRSFVRLS
jgi:hypothetical protein